MPRRVYTYPAAMGWGGMNLLASAGAAMMFVALLIYLINVDRQPAPRRRRRRQPVGARRRSSGRRRRRRPPYNFSPQPTVAGREPLWHSELAPPPIVGLAADKREVLVTYLLDAEPDHRYPMPGPVAVAVPDGDRDERDVRVVDLHAMGVVWGSIPIFVVPDRLVLADEGQGAPRTRRTPQRPLTLGRACHDAAAHARARRQRAADLRVRPPQHAVVGDDVHDRDRGDGVRAVDHQLHLSEGARAALAARRAMSPALLLGHAERRHPRRVGAAEPAGHARPPNGSISAACGCGWWSAWSSRWPSTSSASSSSAR